MYKFHTIILALTILLLLFYKCDTACDRQDQIIEIKGNFSFVLFVNAHEGISCDRSVSLGRTQIASAVWIVKRLNFLHYLHNMKIGLKIFDTCSDHKKEVNSFLELYLNEKKCEKPQEIIQVTATSSINNHIKHLSNFLHKPLVQIEETFDLSILIDATIKFLSGIVNNEEIILISNNYIMEELFLKAAEEENICVSQIFSCSNFESVNHTVENIGIIFGSKSEIQSALEKSKFLLIKWILVPSDGSSEINDVPNKSYIILPTFADYYQTKVKLIKLTPSPILLNIGATFLSILETVNNINDNYCNNNTNQMKCLKTYMNDMNTPIYPKSHDEILTMLQIQPLHDKFVFEVFEIFDDHLTTSAFSTEANENKTVQILHPQPFRNHISKQKRAMYNIFNRSISFITIKPKNRTKVTCDEYDTQCSKKCINTAQYHSTKNINMILFEDISLKIVWRQEVWIAGLVSIAAIGFLCSLAVLTFISIRICKGDILEGNPTGSILLLLTLMLMYLAILPFCVEIKQVNKSVKNNDHGPTYEYILQDFSTEYNIITVYNEYDGDNSTSDVNITDVSTTEESTYDFSTSIYELDENTTILKEDNVLQPLLNVNVIKNEPVESFTKYFENNTSPINQEHQTTSNDIVSVDVLSSTETAFEKTQVYYSSTTEASINKETKINNTVKETKEEKLIYGSATETYQKSNNIIMEIHDDKTKYNKMTYIKNKNNLSNHLCISGVFSISLTYTLAFSLMLSRVIMVASVGNEGGFMSHINGYIQSTLCFFIAIVQIGLCLELWYIYSDCEQIFTGNLFLFLIGYDSFLLIILLFLCPFIFKSQRNYKEGIQFTIGSVLIVISWITWITMYGLVSLKWKHFIISSGLVATATIILVTIFIPRTYLMLTAIVRDDLTNALPSLAHTQSTSVLDLNYRSSNQAIYDCVNPIIISSNMIQASEAPTFPIRGRHSSNYYSGSPGNNEGNEHHDLEHDESVYPQYDTPPSPSKVTRF